VPLDSPNVIAHVGAGALGLLIGLVPLFAIKGGRSHRRGGRVFVAFGAVVLASAIIGVLAGTAPTALVAVTLTAGYQYFGSLRALMLRDRAPGWPDAVCSLVALALAASLLLRGGPGTASWPPALAYGTLGFLALIALYDLSRPLWAQLWLSRARMLDHGLKMTGFYFAMASAGAGNLMREWQPWSQLLPSALGMLAMCVLLFIHLRPRSAGPGR
jgi:hypothetical protein